MNAAPPIFVSATILPQFEDDYPDSTIASVLHLLAVSDKIRNRAAMRLGWTPKSRFDHVYLTPTRRGIIVTRDCKNNASPVHVVAYYALSHEAQTIANNWSKLPKAEQ